MHNNIFASFQGIPTTIWLLATVNFINRCGAMIMCFLSLYITSALGYDIIYAGYAMSIYGIGSIVGQQIGGYFTDKVGYQFVQLLSLILTGIFTLILMQTKDYYLLCVVLFCLNVVSEAFRPANSIAVSNNSDANLRTRSFSLLRVAFNLAIMFALTFGGWLITQGWYYIFWADAITSFASAIALFFLLPNKMTKKITSQEIENINTNESNDTERFSPMLSDTAISNNEDPISKQSLSPYKDKIFLHFILATFFGALAFMQIVWTVPPFFKQIYHWDEFTIGCISAINGFIVMAVEMPFVHRIEKRYANLSLIKVGMIFYILSYLILTLPYQLQWLAAIGYMVLISFGEMLVMPFSITLATCRASKKYEGKYMSLYGMSYSTANIIAPILGTQIIHYFGYTVLWCNIAAIAFIAIIILNELVLKENTMK